MSDNTNFLLIGKEVWWDDPDHSASSGVYQVCQIHYEPDGGLYDDTPILISNGYSEVEVEAWELQDLEIRRKRISELVDCITQIAEDNDWIVYNHEKNFNNINLFLNKYSSAGQDFGFYIQCKTGDVKEFIAAVEDYYDGYNPYEEAILWIGPDGHGKNGAPEDLKELIADMEECKENTRLLINAFKEKLLGIKIPTPSHIELFEEIMTQLRADIIKNISAIVREICNAKDVRSILWHNITNGEEPEICYETASGPASVLPSTFVIADNDQGFYIIFASFCNAADSYCGENLYTETLIKILEHLEIYRNTIQ